MEKRKLPVRRPSSVLYFEWVKRCGECLECIIGPTVSSDRCSLTNKPTGRFTNRSIPRWCPLPRHFGDSQGIHQTSDIRDKKEKK